VSSSIGRAEITDVVDGANIRVIQCGGRLRLTLEAAKRLRITSHLVGQELEGNEAVEAGIFGLIDDAHTPAAELFDHAVVRDRLADHFRKRRLVWKAILWARKGQVNSGGRWQVAGGGVWSRVAG
jgi:hypothetical protein